jgi:hypothetical protein
MTCAILRNLFLCVIIVLSLYSQVVVGQIVPLQYQQNKSFTWGEAISYYKQLDKKYKHAYLLEQGLTDIGKPLHLFVMYGGKNFKRDVIDNRNVPVLLVMNGIHPGEPDGIDASLHWAEWILSSNDSLLKHTCICIIPVYNIDGSFKRSCCSRANQEGPEQYGFRGNAKNLDLNRDFIKMDAKNTESFVKIFQWLQPDLFIDTHVSNGADYQYTFTLLSTQKNKLEKGVSDYLYGFLLPSAENHMEKKGWPMAPYVNHILEIPDSGLAAFYDSPRYSSGYAALFNTPGFVVETHMLKPFPKRVEATLEFLKFASIFMYNSGYDLRSVRRKADVKIGSMDKEFFGLNYKLDLSKSSWIEFLGYEAGYKKSEVTGKNRLYYDTNKPFKKNIPMYWEYICTDSVEKPRFYLIPQGWSTIIEKLKINGVPMSELTEDKEIKVSTYKVSDYTSSKVPYEGHHMKRNVKLNSIVVTRQFYKGDVMIETGTRYDYFLSAVLEPMGEDSYFAWGFFDSMLNQKEWFSDYVWEDKAYEILQNDAALLYEFEKKKMADTSFANDSWQQLYFIYKSSSYFETSYMEYPVYRGIWGSLGN